MESKKLTELEVRFRISLSENDVQIIAQMAFGDYGIGRWGILDDQRWDYHKPGADESATDAIARNILEGNRLVIQVKSTGDEYGLDMSLLRRAIMDEIQSGNFELLKRTEDGLAFDAYNVSSIVADGIIQRALFGEIRY